MQVSTSTTPLRAGTGTSDVHRIVWNENGFAVYLDRNFEVRAELSPEYVVDARCKSIMSEARMAGAIPAPWLREKDREAWKRMEAEAIGLALAKHFQEAEVALATANQFLISRAREISRIWYVVAVLQVLAVLVILGLGLSLAFNWVISASPEFASMVGRQLETANLVVLALVGGVAGAALSLFIRVSKMDIDPASGQKAQRYEAIFRLVIGGLAAVIFVIAVKADVVLGFTENEGNGTSQDWLLAVLAIAAGWSERLVPSFLESFESQIVQGQQGGTSGSSESEHSDSAPESSNEEVKSEDSDEDK